MDSTAAPSESDPPAEADERLAKRLRPTQRDLLLMAASSPIRHHANLDIGGLGSGYHASAKSLSRMELLSCAHPGGPAWGEWNITERGRRVAEVAKKLEKRP